MVADLSLHSPSSKGEANESQIDPDSTEVSWNWNPSNVQDDESWEVKAFAEDASSVMGATWPPRSYACTFCRREFRSAQALGGHMNVHRKDRARLNQSQFLNPCHNPMSTSSSALIIPNNQKFTSGGGLCVMYQLPHPNCLFPPIKMNVPCLDPSFSSSSKTFVSFSPYTSNPMPYPPNTNLQRQADPQGNIDRSTQWSSCVGKSVAYEGKGDSFKSVDFKDCGKEEIDLELRLGKQVVTNVMVKCDEGMLETETAPMVCACISLGT